MKLVLLIGLFMGYSNFGSDSTAYNLKHLVGEWSEARLNTETGELFAAPPSRGGSMALILSEDGKAKWKGALACGFGSQRNGTWEVGKKGERIFFSFTEQIGYMNNPERKAIDEQEVMQIDRLTERELILINGENVVYLFKN